MKYRIIEERDTDGRAFNYQIQFKFIFLWLPVPVGYATLDAAQQALSRLTGTRVVVPNTPFVEP